MPQAKPQWLIDAEAAIEQRKAEEGILDTLEDFYLPSRDPETGRILVDQPIDMLQKGAVTAAGMVGAPMAVLGALQGTSGLLSTAGAAQAARVSQMDKAKKTADLAKQAKYKRQVADLQLKNISERTGQMRTGGWELQKHLAKLRSGGKKDQIAAMRQEHNAQLANQAAQRAAHAAQFREAGLLGAPGAGALGADKLSEMMSGPTTGLGSATIDPILEYIGGLLGFDMEEANQK